MVAIASVVEFGTSENCCLRMSAYVWLVFEYRGLSSRRGRLEGCGSIPGGIDLRTIVSRLSSSQARATGRLDFVVTTKHFVRVTASIRKNHGFRTRWS